MIENFSLEGSEKWSTIEFWEPYICDGSAVMKQMYLRIDYSEHTAQITTDEPYDTDDVSWHRLEENTDFMQFGSFYSKYIFPVVKCIADGDTRDVLVYEIDEKLEHVPTHDIKYTDNLLGAFGENPEELVEFLKNDGIEFCTADLDDEDVLSQVIESIEAGDVILIDTVSGEMRMDRAEFKWELKQIQDELVA